MGTMKKTVLISGASRGIGKAVHDVLSDTGQYTILAPTRQEMNLNEPESIERYLQEVN